MNRDYRLPLLTRSMVICAVLTIAFLSILLGLPLARLMGIDPSQLQGAGFSPTAKTLTLVVLFAAIQFVLVWLAMRFIHRKPYGGLGFKRPVLVPLLMGTGFGMVMQATEYLAQHAAGARAAITTSVPADVSLAVIAGYFLLNVLFLLTLNSLKEEIVYRTYPIEQYNDRPKLMIPVIVGVSLVFAAVHHILLPFAWDAFVSRFTIALLLSFSYYHWRSIWLIAGIHNGLNLLEYLTSGNYKMGGLLKLTMADTLAPSSMIAVDLAIAALFIAILAFIWNKEKQSGRLFFKVEHPA